MTARRVLLVAHHQRAEAAGLAVGAAAWLAEHGHVAFMAPDDAAALSLDALASEWAPASADLVVSLGGDGTMLRAVQMLEGAAVPIIGVNVGLLGYLTEVEPSAMLAALERFVAGPEPDHGDWELEERMMVDVVLVRAGATNGDPPPERWRALNEGVLEKQEAGHTVRLAVSIDDAPFTSYAADGLIVATPTGSTAYSLSARGPVVSPRHRALLLTPVSPHMLFDRSLVLDPDELVEVEVIGHRPVAVSVDGQRVASLAEGDVVHFTASAATAQFVRFGRRRFHQILKSKFGLADR
jgi:NAD+ kinase